MFALMKNAMKRIFLTFSGAGTVPFTTLIQFAENFTVHLNNINQTPNIVTTIESFPPHELRFI